MMSVEMARTAVGRTTIECCVRWCATRCAGSDIVKVKHNFLIIWHGLTLHTVTYSTAELELKLQLKCAAEIALVSWRRQQHRSKRRRQGCQILSRKLRRHKVEK